MDPDQGYWIQVWKDTLFLCQSGILLWRADLVIFGAKMAPRCQFHQHFMSSFCTTILLANNYKPKLQALKNCAKNFGMTVNFTNILPAAFSYQSSLHTFHVLTSWICNFLAKGFWRKSCS
jgi:hypothetical protein